MIKNLWHKEDADGMKKPKRQKRQVNGRLCSRHCAVSHSGHDQSQAKQQHSVQFIVNWNNWVKKQEV